MFDGTTRDPDQPMVHFSGPRPGTAVRPPFGFDGLPVGPQTSRRDTVGAAHLASRGTVLDLGA